MDNRTAKSNKIVTMYYEKAMKTKINTIIFILIIICIINCSCDTTEPKSTGQTGEILEPKAEFTYDKYEDGLCLVKYSGNVSKITVPESVDGLKVIKIGNEAFYLTDCSSPIESVILPDTVKIIGESAFARCTKLRSINTPESLTEIHDGAFYGCSSLEHFTVTDDVTVLEGAFGYTAITDLYIPPHIKRIGSCMFSSTSVDFSVVPETVEIIGQGAFSDNPTITELILPENIISIETFAFSRCPNMVSVSIHKNVSEIGNNAFSGAMLESIDVDPENPYYTSVDGVLYTKDMKTLVIYPAAKKDETFELPQNVEIICSDAFNSNLYMKEIVMHDDLKELNLNTFKGAKSLETLTIPRGVEYLNGSVIQDCVSLRDIYIPDTIKEFDSFGAYGCKNLVLHCSENNPIYKKYIDSWLPRTYTFELDYN